MAQEPPVPQPDPAADKAAFEQAALEQAAAPEVGPPLRRDKIIKNWNKRGDFTRKYNQSIVSFAGRVLRNNEEVHLDEANAALREMCQYHLERPQTLLEVHSFPPSLRGTASMYLAYGPDGGEAPGRLTPETCRVIEDTLWAWAAAKSQLAEADVEGSRTWWISNSENHHAFQFTTCWIASRILKGVARYRDRAFNDGHTALEHYRAWTAYAKEYIRERARKGMLVEIDSPSYTTSTLGCVGAFHSLSDDPELKRLGGLFLELYWALVAEEQLDAITGGAMTRCYPKHTMRGTSFLPAAARTVLGVGTKDGQPSPGAWKAPDVLLKIAHRWQEMAPYEIRQRRMGLAVKGHDRPPRYRLRTDFGGLLRYTYCTPDYIMGSFMMEARPSRDWVAISSQNRWMGVICEGRGRVFPTPVGRGDQPIHNGLWSVQSKGTMIAQQLPARAGGMPSHAWRVFFSEAGLSAPVQEGPWTFVEADSAYVGVRVVAGTTSWGKNGFGRWLVCDDAGTPVVIEAGRKTDHAGFNAFKAAAKARPLSFEKGVVRYESLGGDKLTFHANCSRLPQINGAEVDLAPKKVFDSPFVQSDWDSGIVTLQFGKEKRVLNFNEPTQDE